jgi:multidrug resistance efflux pump
MFKNVEPDRQFVDRLEWQLASEFRRAGRLRPAAGKVAVPRGVVAASLVAGVLLTGVAVSKAADSIRDAWRKKIEMARVETEFKLKGLQLASLQELAGQAAARVAIGLVHEEEYLALKLAADCAALDLKRSELNRQEVEASGEIARDELYAPIVDGRDFVSERLKLESEIHALNLGSLERRLVRVDDLVAKGLVQDEEFDQVRTELAFRKTLIDKVLERLDLRKRFVAGELNAQEVEINGRISAADEHLRQVRARVGSIQEQLERLRGLEARGLVSKTEVEQTRFALEAAKAELSLAALEKDVLEKVK